MRIGQFGLIGVPVLAHLWSLLRAFHVAVPPFPGAWKAAFIASATLFLGNAFIDMFCPPEVKRYGTEDAYQAAILASYQLGVGYRAHVEQQSSRAIEDWMAENDHRLANLIPGWTDAVADPRNRGALVQALSGAALARAEDLSAVDKLLARFSLWPSIVRTRPKVRAAAVVIYLVGGGWSLCFGVVAGFESILALS